MYDDVLSPELVLVTPELRQRAVALLPPFELDRRAPLPPPRAPAPAPPSRRRVLAGTLSLGMTALVLCTLLVLTLTEVADALR
jgi:hypothetical protein